MPNLSGILTYATRPSHTPVCEAVWSMLTCFQNQYQGTHCRVT
ncbi:hypothetical protein F383_17179 [Gossypium arboreum]|uniref:Uncharacterized protein n=1 Tax=Gossypium arboreum TaxID=29729 RepID=A0A0B0NHJ6_GOSAR|nr:hypothetical protein F383_17179 [Gossypium arboreum]